MAQKNQTKTMLVNVFIN